MSDESFARKVVVEGSGGDPRNEVTMGPHSLVADEPTMFGGKDRGPNPYDLLLAALGTCTSMAIVMNARAKGWPLERVRVTLQHASIHAEDCNECHTKKGMIDRLTREIELIGDLTDEQRSTLLEVARHCPVSQMLTHEINIQTVLAPGSATAASSAS
jgi:putative redox protein